jgi:L-histidine N-alpha-methyltransferase
LPQLWLYDARGSSLFEKITRLPEYYLTRAEATILHAHSAEIAKRTGARTLVELGAGTSAKTTILLDALRAAGTLEEFVPFDVSEHVLRTNAAALAARYPGVRVHGIVGDFERHVDALPRSPNQLIAFLGSTVGNLYADRRARLFAAVASTLAADDAFLLGVDLVKDARRLEAAYNDGGGLTEAFLRNGLTAVNRELDADFDHDRFEYVASWDSLHDWMDIGFRARATHTVALRALGSVVEFAHGERLRLEVSAKFRREALELELAGAGLQVECWWTDAAGDFAVLLASRGRGRRRPSAA